MKKRFRFFIAALAACYSILPLKKAKAEDTFTVTIPVSYKVESARAMLAEVNEFRTGDEAWQYKPDGSIEYVIGLKELKYDYKLEQVAKQRAAEIAIEYSHTRPDGQSCYQTRKDLGCYKGSMAENITVSAGPGSAIDSFKETNRNYAGQEHRRAMLSNKYTTIGIACVEYMDHWYWVQEFSSESFQSSGGSAYNYRSEVEIPVLTSRIKGWHMNPDPADLRIGQTKDFDEISFLEFDYHPTLKSTNESKLVVMNQNISFTPDDPDILEVLSGVTLRSKQMGSTIIRSPSPDKRFTLTIQVNVISEFKPDGDDPWTWSSDYSSASIRLISVLTKEVINVPAVISVDEYYERPTCEEIGRGYLIATAVYEGQTYTDEIQGSIPALGHKWETPEYVWSGSGENMICTAYRHCERSARHTVSVETKASYRTITEPTCEKPGKAEYTAVFSSPFTTQKKTSDLPAKGHSLSNITYEWSDDYSTCTANGKCTKCGKIVNETVNSVERITKEPTETKYGLKEVSVSFKNHSFTRQSVYIGIPPTGGTEEIVKISMYRLYNPNSYEHFYTGNAKEKDALVKMGWKYEGIGWYAPETSNTPVYRLYNPNNGGDHHYTKNKKEYDALCKAGWKGEDIRWYSDDAKGVPVYREYNPGQLIRNHNYTANKKEHDYLVNTAGWKNEGIGWYGVK